MEVAGRRRNEVYVRHTYAIFAIQLDVYTFWHIPQDDDRSATQLYSFRVTWRFPVIEIDADQLSRGVCNCDAWLDCLA